MSKFNFVQQKNRKGRFLLAAALALVLIGQFAASGAQGQYATPAFNIYTPFSHTQAEGRDYFLLDAKNDTKHTSWGFPVSADPGDILTFSVYYHNAVLDSTARNTRMRVELPLQTGLSHVVGAALWADNASNASFAAPMTQGLPVNVSLPSRLEWIAGSVRWYPDQRDWRIDAPVAFPFGQNGAELFSSGGLSIGDIRGCWEFSGYLIFKARVIEQYIPIPQNPELSIIKNVRNLTSGAGLAKSVDARNGDRVQFQVEIRNTGDTLLHNVMLRDGLPYSFNHVGGSARLDGSAVPEQIFGGGINIGSLAPGACRTLIFDAIVDAGNINATLTNVAFARADEVGERSDWANVCVSSYVPPYYPPVPPPPVPQPTPSPFLKQVANLTRPNGTPFENTALVGDQLQYTLSYTNQSSVVIENAQIFDVLPSHVSFVDAANSGVYNASANEIVWQIGSLAAGATAQASYRVNVMASVPYDGFIILNTALFKATGIQVVSNEVRTKITLPVVKGEVKVKAITGASLVTRNSIFSFLLAMILMGIVYLVSKKNVADWLKLRWIVLKVKARS